MFNFGRITLFCSEKRLSKHKMTIFSKNQWGHGPFIPLAPPMLWSSLGNFLRTPLILCVLRANASLPIVEQRHVEAGTEFAKKFGGNKPYCLRFDDVTISPNRSTTFCKIGQIGGTSWS